MNRSDPQTYRAMAIALRDLANQTHRPDKRAQLQGLAGRCELMAAKLVAERLQNASQAARIEREWGDSPEIDFGGEAA